MLTKRQNFIECIKGGNPDRYVNQFEALELFLPMPFTDFSRMESEGIMVDPWGVYQALPEGNPGLFPMHDMEHRVIKDFEEWRDQVKIPEDPGNDTQEWERLAARAETVDRKEKFVCVASMPGIFERVHSLCEITEALVNFYEEPELMHELIDEVVEYEMCFAKASLKYLKPDALFHHDDWGTQISTFMSNDMFEEFLLEPYKKVYSFYKDNGIEVIIHHSDSYGMTLIPYMRELGIDVWQGTLRSTNDIPKIVDENLGHLAVMGGIESQLLDKPDWTKEEVEKEVEEAITSINRKTGFIPCLTSGMNESGYPGMYDAVTEAIDRMSVRDFS